jgi:hypothetical protein
LIEFITSVNQLKAIPVEETEDFIFKSLNNPKEIWHFAYDQQLNEEEKFLLMTLFSLGAYNVPSDQLEKAFEARYTFEIKENGFVLKTDAYQQSLRKLLDGFIKSEKNPNDGHLTFGFLNPSIGDFVINFLGSAIQRPNAFFIQLSILNKSLVILHPNLPMVSSLPLRN